jgi:hypothetical protein|tara:strand:+ start:3254 stop:3640 length:387 start_codon:yes stop_codon:yes gene_type:complete
MSQNKKFPTSLKVLENRAIMFLYVNQKKPSGKAFARYDKYKTANSITEAVDRGWTPLDMQYETKSNNRFKKFVTMCFIEGVNITKETKDILEFVIKKNREVLKDLPKAIQEKAKANIDKFDKLAQSIK